MTLLEYMHKHDNMNINIDAIIGNVDPVATICWDKDEYQISPYCMEKYGDILNAEINIIDEDFSSEYNYVYSTIEVLGDIDWRHGAELQMSMCGNIPNSEYTKLFREESIC